MIQDPGVREPDFRFPRANTGARGLTSISSAGEYFQKTRTRRKTGEVGNLKMILFIGARWKGEGVAMRNKERVQTLRGSWMGPLRVLCRAVPVQTKAGLHSFVLWCSWMSSHAPNCPLSWLPRRGPASSYEALLLTLLMKARSEAKTCFSDTSDCPFLRKARWISNTFFINGLWPSLFKSWLYKT